MKGPGGGPRSLTRMFAVYAAMSVVLVGVLYVLFTASLRSEADQRGLAEGRSEAELVARSAVEPLLDGHLLSGGLNASELVSLRRLTDRVIAQRNVLRLRLRDLSGRVVFSDDDSGHGDDDDDDEALEAAGGSIVARLTRLNSDVNDTGRAGPESVEVYQPLRAGKPLRRVGVLELYLPYAPIARDVTAGLHRLDLDIALGLSGLALVLGVLAWSMSRYLRREARYDPLTKLPNRTLFHEQASDAVDGDAGVTIAILDLDRFKEVNDTLGHDYGDELLKELGVRLSGAVRAGDTVAHLGGDEFALILRETDDPEKVLRRVLEEVGKEVSIGGISLTVGASIGYEIASIDRTDVGELLQRAEVAMYAAKSRHQGIARYDSALDHYDADNLSLVGELRHGIEDGQLVLHYQPQTAFADGRVCALEALVRWQHPGRGLVPPDRFIPLAEQTDLIDTLTSWVLRTALRDLQRLGADGEHLSVSVNVSRRSLGQERFADDVIAALTELGVAPERLTIEITETAIFADPDRALGTLRRLADTGVKVSVDDFGRGYTSLGSLSALPIHELKVDKRFVLDMLENPAHAAIVRSIVDLGHNLGLRVIGEGVETESVLSTLRSYGCDLAQGFLLARPMPPAELAAWLLAAPPARNAA
jgi:diguanylate cyclase (GGDEF)-like protein